MIAVVLADDAGRRAAPPGPSSCLRAVGGRAVLVRMLAVLHQAAIRDVCVIAGHDADELRAATARPPRGMRVRVVDTRAHAGRGALASLHAARHALHAPALLVDGGVLVPRLLLGRLLVAPAPSALLVDRAFRDTGEEIKVYTRGARVVAVGKKIVPEAWDAVGRGVGLLRCGAEALAELHRLLERAERDAAEVEDQEAVLHALVGRCYVGGIDVAGLPWIDGDGRDDVKTSPDDVWPRIARLDGA
jgi:choline kinase